MDKNYKMLAKTFFGFEDILAEEIVSNLLHEGDNIEIDVDDKGENLMVKARESVFI